MNEKYANRIGYTDIEPYEIVGVFGKQGKGLIIRAMDSVMDFKPEYVPGGFACHCTNNFEQEWVITSNEKYTKIKIRQHKDGKWYDSNGNNYRLHTKPVKFYDFNF